MTIAELKEVATSQKERLKEKSGSLICMSEKGPIGMSMIDAIIRTLETMQTEIEALKSEISK